MFGVVGVILSRFLGVERSCILAQGAACSPGVVGGDKRAFLRGDAATRRSCTASSLLLLFPEPMSWLALVVLLEVLRNRVGVDNGPL